MKIFCVGRNYAEHANELKNAVPESPVIFLKPKTALYNPATAFFYPEFTNELHYEAELVIRIGKNGRYIHPKQALSFIDQLTVGIDFTARDIQSDLKAKGLPWEKAKAWDNSAVIGSWTKATPEMLNAPIHFSMQKNGETVQKGITTDMIFSFKDIIADVSKYFSLNIGDLIFTGTPAGVGECVVGDQFKGFLEDQQVFDMTIS